LSCSPNTQLQSPARPPSRPTEVLHTHHYPSLATTMGDITFDDPFDYFLVFMLVLLKGAKEIFKCIGWFFLTIISRLIIGPLVKVWKLLRRWTRKRRERREAQREEQEERRRQQNTNTTTTFVQQHDGDDEPPQPSRPQKAKLKDEERGDAGVGTSGGRARSDEIEPVALAPQHIPPRRTDTGSPPPSYSAATGKL
ncbi:uncharacterized protein BKA78DRAFT_375051, partial [Phyllosticta capitalensis]|uniref:uncharacterized protein n=1 Tax=Phyllosticta capitalensis TaxID=121624 RepID=UPI0031306258